MIAAATTSSYQSSYDGAIKVHPLILNNLLSENRKLKAERNATRELMANRHNSPAVKVTTYNALLETGAAPGVPAPHRPFEYVRIGCDIIGEKSGLSAKRVGTHLGAAVDAGLLRRKVEIQRANDGTPHRVYSYAPPEGPEWERTWAHPATIEEIVSPTHTKDAKRKSDERAHVRAILAQCPECGSTDVDLRCRSCGCVTPVEDIPDAPTATAAASGSGLHRQPPMEPSSIGLESVPMDDALNDAPIRDESSLMGNVTYKDISVPMDDAPIGLESVPMDETPNGDADGTPSADDQALAAAVAVLTPALTHAATHVEMLPRRRDGDTKYVTRPRPATMADVEAHLRGLRTCSSELACADPLQLDGRVTRAVAWDWDDDTDLQALRHAAKRLTGRGWTTLLIRNPVNPHRGHLWVFFVGPVDAAQALSAAEFICPELAACKERFPDPKTSNGGRLRWPGGRYLPVGAPSLPVLVAAGVEAGLPQWVDGTTPAAWALIAASVNPVSLVETAWVAPDARPQPSKLHLALVKSMASPAASPPKVARDSGDTFDFARFNRDNPVEVQIEVNRQGFFAAPWRSERTPSVKLYDDGRWKDYGPDGRYGDAFDLWCALSGHWPDGADKPNRRAALEALGALEPRAALGSTEPPPPPIDVLIAFDDAGAGEECSTVAVVSAPWRPTIKPPDEHFCRDVLPTGKACPACGGVRWRLRETPLSDGQWLWACAGCADRRAAYTAQHTTVPSAPLNIAATHSTITQEDDDEETV